MNELIERKKSVLLTILINEMAHYAYLHILLVAETCQLSDYLNE